MRKLKLRKDEQYKQEVEELDMKTVCTNPLCYDAYHDWACQ